MSPGAPPPEPPPLPSSSGPGLENVSRETLEDLKSYAALLVKWQARINLIGPTTVDDLWTRHIADSLQLLPLAPPAATTWVDLGSGAGLPGLVLAIALKAQTGVAVHLFESDQRKAAFLREAARITAAPAEIHAERIEAAAPFPADVVTARAFAPLDRLLDFAAPFWTPGTAGLFPKGRNALAECEAASKRWRFTYHLVASHTDSSGNIVVLRSLSRV